MKIEGIKATTYWRKTYSVEAVRLTDENLQTIADYLGAELCVKSGKEPFINYGGDEGYVGEWIVARGENFRFYSHEDFLQAFWTHSEELSSNEQYARVFQLVASAMRRQDTATYQGDTSGMDLVVIEVTKKILREL